MSLTYDPASKLQRITINTVSHQDSNGTCLVIHPVAPSLPLHFYSRSPLLFPSRSRAAGCHVFTSPVRPACLHHTTPHPQTQSAKPPTMALTLAKSEVAHYLHATLERFDTIAIQEISRLLYAAAAHVAVKQELVELSYDERNHIFTLKHHNCYGSQLDEALGRIIRNYVANESDAVTRFAECALGDPFDDEEIGSEQGVTQSVCYKVSITHMVSFDGINTYGKAKAFYIRDLPPPVRNRMKSRHNVEHLATAISLRHVRVEAQSEEQVFGGSVGTTLPKLTDDEKDDMHWLFKLLSFASFTRKITLPVTREPVPEVMRRDFNGKEPAIGQWLEGMGETGQIDPEVQPEMGGEQFQFARGRTLQNDFTARIRKPKGIPLADHQLPESPQDEQPDVKPSGGFAALMRSDAIGDTSSGSESGDSGSDEVNPFEGMKQVKTTEPAKSEGVSAPGAAFTPLSTPQEQQKSSFIHAAPTTNAASSRAHPNKSQFVAATPSSQGDTTSEGGFPNDGRSYARADRFGLTGDAANHVAWEKENAASLLHHHSRRLPLTYDAMASTRAESVSTSFSAGLNPRMDSQPIAAVTPMSYNETPLGGNEPWAKNVVRPDIFVPTGNLVSTDVPIADTGRPKPPQYPPGLVNTYADVANTRRSPWQYPPGLYPALGSNERQQPKIINATNASPGNAQSRHPTASQIPARETSSKSTGQGNDDLMSFKDDDDVPLVEHDKAQEEEAPRLYRTMRQQAGPKPKTKQQKKKKHNKGSSSKSTASRPAVLELPSPPPPPKPKPPTAVKPNEKSQGIVRPESSLHLEQAVSDLVVSCYLDGEFTGVEVSFGLALMTDAGDLIVNRGLRSADMQEMLDELPSEHRNTVFPLVLGRLREDGVYLLRLPTTLSGTTSPYVGDSRLLDAWQDDDGPHRIDDKRIFEINVTVPGGSEWLIVFDQDMPDDLEIRLLQDFQQQTSIYVHYPERVWDARIRTRSSGFKHPELDEDLERNIETFIKTFNTIRRGGGSGSEPNFEAVVPNNAFVVTNVLAKRVLIRNLMLRDWETPTSSWVVSQVWDLHVQYSPSSLSRAGNSSLTVSASDETTMRGQGRLWWEASLVVDEVPHQEEDGTLEILLNEIVAKLDSVGMPPIGAVPKVKPDKEKKASKAYVPYW